MKKLNYSYNPIITSEMSKDEAAKKTRGWKLNEIEWSDKCLTEMVKNHSYIPSKLKDGEKLKENVEEVYFLALDFDKGETSFEKYRDVRVQYFQFAAFMHTTVNHQKELTNKTVEGDEVVVPARDKFRVIIPFSRAVKLSELEEMKSSGVIQHKFSLREKDIDMSCMDGNRYFKQNADAITYFHDFDEFLDPDTLLQKSSTNKTQKKVAGKKVAQKFSLNAYLTKADGTQIQVKEVEQKEQIFCPFCDLKTRSHPDKANAFIDFNGAGSLYISCSSEQKTYWQESSRIDASKSNLFWNTTVGAPSVVGYDSVEDDKKCLLRI